MIKMVNDEGLEEAVLGGDGYLVGAFVQVASIPCGHFLPELKALSEILDGRAKFVMIEVTENPTIADDLGVQAVPTTLVWKGGEEVARYEGPYSKESLNERISELMLNRKPPSA